MKSDHPNFKLLTPGRLQLLLNHSKDLRDQVILGLKAQAGLRHTEACRFRLCFVDWAARLIRLPGFYAGEGITKVGVPRDIPICPALYDLLRRLKDSGYPETDLVMIPEDNRLRVIAAKASVDLPPNALRHAFATYRLQILQNVNHTAGELGTSAAFTKMHFAAPQPDSVSKMWFAVKAPLLPPRK